MWRSVSDNPNSPQARGHRQGQLRLARKKEAGSRNDVITDASRGRRVLDVGCAGHANRIGGPDWLHGRIASVATEVAGIDIDAVGVQAMVFAGYNAIVASIEERDRVRDELGSFELVVAADVIEHLRSPQALLELAATVLLPGGLLLLTTPNPLAPWRIRAGRRHLVRENVDHVVLAFPSGVAEMADRAGLELVSYTSVGFLPPHREVRRLLGELRAHRRWRPVMMPWDYLVAVRHGVDVVGETSIYLLEKPRATTS
jgi:2-polyprenyl-3-methyl-5-hydroxy-6-metoxy-1,4-benzoquinol methylase